MPSTPAGVSDNNTIQSTVQRWADGRATLKDVRGYTDEELYAVARTALAFFNQGKVAQARTIYQGLFAVNPRNAYFARALGVVEYAAGNPESALAAWDVAIKLDPKEPAGYVGRAEVLLATGHMEQAREDFKRAVGINSGDPRQITKARSLLKALRKRTGSKVSSD